jgi:hypothetical protein
MELLSNLWLGFSVAMHWQNMLYCFIGVMLGTLIGGAAGHRPHRHDLDAAAGDVRAAAGLRAHHARGHLLRSAVRRIHHGDPREPAGRGLLGR